MRRTAAVIGSALFFVAAPSVVAGLIPWWITRWEFLPPFFDLAVVAVILGQAILFGDWRLMTYGGLMWLAFHAFALTYEEPVLAQQFGVQYEDFRANVPRWIPRLTAWRGGR
jgi:hypothetical protein